MSEELARTDWAEAEVMTHYRAEVQDRADRWKAMYPNAWRKTEIREPEKAAHAVYLLAESDLKQQEIADVVGLAPKELNGLIYHRPELWEKRRPRAAEKLAIAQEMLADAMIQKAGDILSKEDELAKTPVKDLALALGIVSDKAASYNGMATTVVEHRSGPTIEDAISFREGIRARLAEKAKSEAIDV